MKHKKLIFVLSTIIKVSVSYIQEYLIKQKELLKSFFFRIKCSLHECFFQNQKIKTKKKTHLNKIIIKMCNYSFMVFGYYFYCRN